MKRREFIPLIGGAMLGWPLGASAQRGERMRRIGVLMNLAEDDPEGQARFAALLQGLREIISSAMHLQSQNATGQAGLLIGRDQLVRLNATSMPDNPIALDAYDRARSELPPIAAKLVSTQEQIIQERFLFDEAEPYEAFYGPGALATSK